MRPKFLCYVLAATISVNLLANQPCAAALWVSGYYPGYKQCDKDKAPGTEGSCDPNADGIIELMSPEEIDFSTVTHVIHFALTPGLNVVSGNPDVDYQLFALSPSASTQLITAAHAAKRKAIISVGGAKTRLGLAAEDEPDSHLSTQVHGGFQAATSTPEKVNRFVEVLVNFMQERGYDGIDLDWEPFCIPKEHCTPADDSAQFVALVNRLRTKLDSLAPEACNQNGVRAASCPLLTAAISDNYLPILGTLQGQFDQLNLMTYDMTSPWFENNWMTWFNAPLYNDKAFVMNGDNPFFLPSIDKTLQAFLVNTEQNKTIPANKLGLGIPFYGRIWSGGDNLTCTIEPCRYSKKSNGAIQPRQSWRPGKGQAPKHTWEQYDYAQLMTTNKAEKFTPENFFWDYAAESSYLSIDDANNAKDRFITYDDEMAVSRKVRYAQANHLGGVMLWELPAGYLAPSSQQVVIKNNANNQCLEAINDLTIATTICDTEKSSQTWIYNNQHQLINGKCLTLYNAANNTMLANCPGSRDIDSKARQWVYEESTGQIRHIFTNRCLTIDSSTQSKVINCSTDKNQRWTFTSTSPANAQGSQPLLHAIKQTLGSNNTSDILIYHTTLASWQQTAYHEAQINPDFAVDVPAHATLAASKTAIKISTSQTNAGLTLTHVPKDTTLHPGQVAQLSLALYVPPGQKAEGMLGIMLENTWQNWFPQVVLDTQTLKPVSNYPGWYTATLGMQTLNPWGRLFNRINFINLAPNGNTSIFYLGNIVLESRE